VKWQLSDDKNLVPNSYNFGIKLNWETQKTSISDIDRDFLTYYKDIKIRETFQIGFGELCYIHDALIRPINQIIKGENVVLPQVVQRLRSSLPPDLFLYYFPKFASNTNELQFFDFNLPDVGNCNPSKPNCKDMPLARKFTSDENGIRQYNRLMYDANFNLTPVVISSDEIYYKFMNDLKKYNYCSPYV
jgi:hypothetical protein